MYRDPFRHLIYGIEKKKVKFFPETGFTKGHTLSQSNIKINRKTHKSHFKYSIVLTQNSCGKKSRKYDCFM